MIISKIEIFNRWEKLIHEVNFPEIFWDGKINNENSYDEVYYWIVEYKNLKGIEKTSHVFQDLIR